MVSLVMLEEIFRCNFNASDVKYIVTSATPQFWNDVLLSWAEFNFNTAFDLHQMLWFNSHIQIADTPIFWKKCYTRGLHTAWQLFPDGRAILVERATVEFNLSQMELNSLISATLKLFRRMPVLTNATREAANVNNYDVCTVRKGLSKFAYADLIRKRYGSHILELKWMDEVTKFHWTIDYDPKSIYTITNSVKLRSFQFRLIHKAIVLNSHLFRWGLREDNLCSFCNASKETITHLFYDCNIIKEIWQSLAHWLSELGLDIQDFSAYEIIFNCFANNPRDVLNTIGLIVKQLIYRNRCLKKGINFNEVKNYIMFFRSIEKVNALRSNSSSRFYKKWNCIDL